MTEEAMKARREYNRKWAREHADKVRAAQERYWKRRAEAAAEEAAAQEITTPDAKAESSVIE